MRQRYSIAARHDLNNRDTGALVSVAQRTPLGLETRARLR
jgi:hypothetical protein